MNAPPPDFPARIKALRMGLQLSQKAFAERLGVSFSTVNRWENGHNTPSDEFWERIEELEHDGAVAPAQASVVEMEVRPAAGLDFAASPAAIRAVVEGERLAAGHTTSPTFATEIARVEPLPHQRIAVYERMLPQPRLRFLLADDPGAGKTIMSGLYIREMLARRLIRRVLVAPPAGLVGNWRREMANLFELEFAIVTGDDMKKGNPFAGAGSDLVIVSIDTLRQPRALERLREPDVEPYDLVVFDEAHKLTVRQTSDGGLDKTKRYRLAEALAGVPLLDEAWRLPWSARHLLLLTATPHMGSDFPYYGLWRLLDPEVFATPEAFERYPADAMGRYFLRRTKEEMVRLDGARVYPPRLAATFEFDLSPAEDVLYRDVTRYMQRQYNQAKILNQSAAQLAMSVFQRRLASSTFALARSLARRVEKLEALYQAVFSGEIPEEELERRQQALGQKLNDPFEAYTADEEDTSEGHEAHEDDEDLALGGIVALSLADIADELTTVRDLHAQAEAVLADGYDAKFDRLVEYLNDPAYEGEKLLLFTEHKDTLDFLVQRLGGLGFADRIAQIHGGMGYAERDAEADRFRVPADRGGALLLVGTDAAGEGINLQVCWRMVNYDVPWNPARLEQRMGRIHRYGQQHEFVSIVNLVAADTREGKVLGRLLEKLDAIREAFQQQDLPAGKVFDVIGRVFQGVSLKEYMTRLMTGEADEDTLIREIDDRLTEGSVRAALDAERTRYVHADDITEERLQALRAEIERERLRELLPGYVLRYLREAFPLLGLEPPPEDPPETDRFFALRAVRPGALDGLLDALERYPEHVRDRLTVYRPERGAPDAIWLRPGEALFEAIRALVHVRFEEDALRGAAFVDPGARTPYFLHIGAVGVERDDERGGTLLEHRLVALQAGDDGGRQEVPLERLLLLRGAHEVPVSHRHLLRRGPLSAMRAAKTLEDIAEERAEAHRALRRATLPDREHHLRTGFDHRLAQLATQRSKLRQAAGKGGGAIAKMDAVKEEQRALRVYRDAALDRLRQEPDLIRPATPEMLAHILVLPSVDPQERKRFDAEIEARAMKVALDFERTRGARVFDVSNPAGARALGLSDWPGFDVLSEHPDEPHDRAIEVKGRAGDGGIELTENEWSKACNLRERYWLYVIFHCATVAPELRIVRDPFGKLIGRARTSIYFDASDIRRVAEPT